MRGTAGSTRAARTARTTPATPATPATNMRGGAQALPPLVSLLLRAQCTVRLYHWSTTSYARHVASDDLLGRLEELGDRLVELHLGRAGRPAPGALLQVEAAVPDDEGAVRLLGELEDALRGPGAVDEQDPGAVTVRDELLSALGRARYLFGLRA